MHRALSVLASPSTAAPSRAASLVLLLSLTPAPVAGQDPPVGQAGSVWNLGTLVAGRRYPTTVTAVNRSCKGKHDFQLGVDEAAAFLRIEGDALVKGLAPGQAKTLPAVVDLAAVAPGVYDRGHLVSRCLDCPPSCRMDYQTINLRMIVVAPPPTAPPDSSSPPEREEPLGVCGPDVSRALEEAMERTRLRKARLPAGAVPDFTRRKAPFRLIAQVVPLCPTPAVAECRETVWLWGSCVPAAVPEWILEGYTRGLYGKQAIFPPDDIEWADFRPDDFGDVHRNARVIGVSRTWGTMDPVSIVLRDFIPRIDSAGARRCRPCGDSGVPFSRDTSKEVWVLADGSHVSYPE